MESREMKNQGTFKVTMEFLRDIVAKHIFHDAPAAALRELIQNAHDACLIQSALEKSEEGYSVHVTLDPIEKRITIQDNGVGMTQGDIEEYLTSIGRGKKGVSVAEKYGVPARSRDRLKNVIGEFGFGFIAAFIIADKIELWTRYKDSPTIHCVFSTEDVAYRWEESESTLRSGTRLVLHLNQSTLSRALKPTDNPLEGNILSWDTVDAIVKKYCIFLEFPIYISMEGELTQSASNQLEIPWKQEGGVGESVQRFYENRFGKGSTGEFLKCFPISLSRQNGNPIDLEGILILEDRPQTTDLTGNLEIFIKRMWVCDGAHKLLPAWAAFLRGIIVTPELKTEPGRDSIDVDNDSFDRVKGVLHDLVYDCLLELARKNARVFNTMLDRYGPMFRWGLIYEKKQAEKERRQFREGELLRYVRFVRYGKRYATGNICTLNDYLGFKPDEPLVFKDNKRRVVYFVARPVPADRQLEFRRLLASKSVDVIVPNDEYELDVLMNFDEVFPGILLSNVENEILKDVGLLGGDERARWSSFLKYYEKLAKIHHMAGAEVGAFEPEYMPTMILNTPRTEPSGSGPNGEPEDGDKTPRPVPMPGVPPELASFYDQILVINSRNRLMKQLLEYKDELGLEDVDQMLDGCLHQCYHIAIESAIGNLPSDMLLHHVEVESQIIRDYTESRIKTIGAESVERARLEELEVLRKEKQSYMSCYGELQGGDKLFAVPSEPVERMCVVMFCDMVDSTGNLLGMDFKERGFVLNRFVTLAKKEVQQREGFFDKFTGDGFIALFGIEQEKEPNSEFNANDWNQACRNAWMVCNAMRTAMVDFNNSKEIRLIIDQHGLSQFALRMSIDAGPVQFGRFGGAGTAVGRPVIVAARLCDETELYRDNDTDILVTENFLAKSGMRDFNPLPATLRAKGVGGDVKVYKN